jgi:hypothetical protein
MSQFFTGFSITILIGLLFTLLVLCGIIAWTNRISFRLRKVELPKWRLLFAFAFLQILLGVLTIFVVRAIKNDPFLDIGSGLGVAILSGLVFIKMILKTGWKQALRVWVIAAGMQLVLVPVCSTAMLVVWVMLSFLLFPPQL